MGKGQSKLKRKKESSMYTVVFFVQFFNVVRKSRYLGVQILRKIVSKE